MVDTTTDNRVLHFLQTDFKASGDETAIASSSQPIFAYQAPGTLGEGGSRQYSFLLYQQTNGIAASSLPKSGQTVDIQKFQSDNGLKDPLAGVIMVVDLAATSVGPAQQTAAASPSVVSQTTAHAAASSSTVEPATLASSMTSTPSQASAAAASSSQQAEEGSTSTAGAPAASLTPSNSEFHSTESVSKAVSTSTIAAVTHTSKIGTLSTTMSSPTATTTSASGASMIFRAPPIAPLIIILSSLIFSQF